MQMNVKREKNPNHEPSSLQTKVHIALSHSLLTSLFSPVFSKPLCQHRTVFRDFMANVTWQICPVFSCVGLLCSLVLFQSSLCFLLCYCLCLGGAPSEDMQSSFLLSYGGCPELGASHIHEQHTTSGFPVQILVPSMAIRTVHCFCGSCSSTLLHVHVLVLVSREWDWLFLQLLATEGLNLPFLNAKVTWIICIMNRSLRLKFASVAVNNIQEHE